MSKKSDHDTELEPQEAAETVEAETPTPDDYLAMLKRAQADFANYKKRVSEEREALGQYLNQELILSLLPVLDNFKLATKHLPDEIKDNEWVKGITAIERQFEQTLEAEGLSKIPALGEHFDPSIHEAVDFRPGDEDGVVIEEISEGYKLGDKVIRATKVVVGKKANQQEEK